LSCHSLIVQHLPPSCPPARLACMSVSRHGAFCAAPRGNVGRWRTRFAKRQRHARPRLGKSCEKKFRTNAFGAPLRELTFDIIKVGSPRSRALVSCATLRTRHIQDGRRQKRNVVSSPKYKCENVLPRVNVTSCDNVAPRSRWVLGR
jgi:hypothetical protein